MNRIARMPTPRDRDFMTIFGFGDDEAPMRTICHRWCVASHTSGLRATLGVDASGRPLSVDIDSEGPHAIVAGTTGSGKSVLLQCWCLTLAVTYPPDRLGFVFLDFKGGSALDCLTALPHVRGCVNDLDLSYASRALRALEDELSCREHLAARHHVSDIRQLPDAPAQLMIVVDEFHMLNEQLPGYMDRLLRVASLGRSLGMHLVVCTQNPMVEINASMKANMSLRICLRVQDAMQSQEMIGSALASTIPADCPGTAVLNHEGECVILQCLQPSNIRALTVQIHQSARFSVRRTVRCCSLLRCHRTSIRMNCPACTSTHAAMPHVYSLASQTLASRSNRPSSTFVPVPSPSSHRHTAVRIHCLNASGGRPCVMAHRWTVSPMRMRPWNR